MLLPVGMGTILQNVFQNKITALSIIGALKKQKPNTEYL
jgi:hypothetical protein